MRTTIAAAVVAAVLLTGCTTDHTGEASAKAREACGTTGTPGHTTWIPDSGGPTGTDVTVAELTKFAAETDRSAGIAAEAAVQDPSWNDLAEALSSLASIAAQVRDDTEKVGWLTNTTDPALTREVVDTLYAECRKAHAAH